MNRRHWTEKDFIVTATSPAYDGSDAVNRFGYCAVCKGDMQSFASEGRVLHYNSHTTAKRLGLWGKAPKTRKAVWTVSDKTLQRMADEATPDQV